MQYLDTFTRLNDHLWTNTTPLQKIWIAWTLFNLLVLFPLCIHEKWMMDTRKLKPYNEEKVRWGHSWTSYHNTMNMYYWLSIAVALEQIVFNMYNVQAIPLPYRATLWKAYRNITTVAFRQMTVFFHSAVGYCIWLNTQIKTVAANYLCIWITFFSYLANLAAKQAKVREQAALAPPDWLFAPETYGNQMNQDGITIYNDDGTRHTPVEYYDKVNTLQNEVMA